MNPIQVNLRKFLQKQLAYDMLLDQPARSAGGATYLSLL
jgi:hypothetical protein